MRRRELLAGLGSAGVVVGGGAAAVYGLPSAERLLDGNDDSDSREPIEVETIDAPGSDAGTVSIPDLGRVTFVDFFGTWCGPCIEQMPALAEAAGQFGDEVLFCSVTNESISEAELADWWDEHGGNWTVGIDPAAELTSEYPGGVPRAVAIDDGGVVQWSSTGIKTADELVAGIDQAIAESDVESA